MLPAAFKVNVVAVPVTAALIGALTVISPFSVGAVLMGVVVMVTLVPPLKAF